MRNIKQINFHQKVGLVSDLLKALAHPARLVILCQLVSGERSVTDLHKTSHLSLSAFSQHLGVLRKRKLVATRKQNQTVFYSLADKSSAQILNVLHDLYCQTPAKGGGRSVC